ISYLNLRSYSLVSGVKTTADATVTGSLGTYSASRANIKIEIDQDNDNDADGTAWTDANGNFTYVARPSEPGSVIIRARALRWDLQNDDYVVGSWSAPLTFTYAPAAGPTIQTLGLLQDTGSLPADGHSYVSTLTGVLSGTGSLGGITIEFDYDNDESDI